MQQQHLRLELVFLRISTSSGWLNDSEILRQRLGQLRAQQRQQRQRTIHSLLFDLNMFWHGCWCPLCVELALCVHGVHVPRGNVQLSAVGWCTSNPQST